MSRHFHRLGVALSLCALATTGCHPSRPFYFFENGDMAHYRDVATEVEYPDVETNTLAEVSGAMAPLTVRNTDTHDIWDLTLEEAVQNSLNNSKVMRRLGATSVDNLNAGLLSSPRSFPTIYDPAIEESNPRTGVEGALSAFDAQFSTSMFWERNDRPVNLTGVFTSFLAPTLQQDLGTFQSEIRKTAATGGTFFLRNNTRYDFNNNPSNLFPSSWNTNFEAEFRHPLLQGAGVQFNRIAGPNASPGSFTFGFGNGVVLARINTDIALSEFETGIRNLVMDVEKAYWDLYYAYRNLDALIAGRDSALSTWRRVYALYQTGAEGGRAAEEAQSREQYYLFVEQVHRALNVLYKNESELRRMMGLATTDGRLIRPSEEPTTAKVNFDWFELHNEALSRSAELRRQKWQVKRREMELVAARNFLLPRLDAVGRYRWLGFGDDFIRSDRSVNRFDNAFQNLTSGDFQEWQMGGQLTIPIGFRQALAGVRNAQLSLARDRSVLQDQELELSHQLSNALRQLEADYTSAQDNFNRRIAAKRQVEAVRAAYDVGQVTLDLLLDAQRRLADAESQYHRALVEYNKNLAFIHFVKGSLLEYNGVYLAEGPWPGKAYFDAQKRGRERDSAHPVDYGFTRPYVFSRGPLSQHQYRTAGQPGPAAPTRDARPGQPTGETVPQPPPADPDLNSLPEPSAQRPAPPVPTPDARAAAGPQRTAPFVWGSLGLGGPQASPAATAATASRGWVSGGARTVAYEQPTSTVHHETRAYHQAGPAHRAAPEWQGTTR